MKKSVLNLSTSAILTVSLGIFLNSATSLAARQVANPSAMPPNVSNILESQCFQCHGKDGQNQGGVGSILDMASLIHHGFITPGKPLLSTLIRKVESGEMPLNGQHLDPEDITTLKNWIASLPPAPAKAQKVGTSIDQTSPGDTPVTSLPSTTSVLQHHAHLNRDGLYVEPTFTRDSVKSLKQLPSFVAKVEGDVYAQMLYVEKASHGRDVLVVATEKNKVYGFDGLNGNKLWEQSLGPSVALKDLPCGNIDPLGVTGTPVVDTASNTIILDAMQMGPNKEKQHWVHRLSLEDGSPQSGWPINVGKALSTQGLSFNAQYQNERGGLLILNGNVYIPYGGHFGDCGDYHGWIVSISLASPGSIKAWKTSAKAGGIWAPAGLSSDGASLYFATGNTENAKTWSGGEGIFKLGSALSFSKQQTEFFSPTNWQGLDDGDTDIGGTAPIPVEVPGANPSNLVVGFGKDGFIYVLDQNHMGGISKPIVGTEVSDRVITATASYTTSHGTFVVIKGHGQSCPGGQSGDLTAFRINPTSPPSVTTAWCASENGTASPIVTTTDGHSNAIVWGMGAEGDNKLHAIDGETGATLFDGTGTEMDDVKRFQSAIVASGRLFAVGGGKIYAFSIH